MLSGSEKGRKGMAQVRLLRLGVQGLPLIEAVCRDEATATLKGSAPHRLARNGFRLRVDGRETLSDALFIGSAIVAATHILFWDESCLYQLGTQGLHLDMHGAACLKVFTNTVHFGLV
jgi:hypothetical protein